MTTCQTPDPGRVGQFTHTCPACDGIMPAESVTLGKWKTSKNKHLGAGLIRMVSMQCPHCDYCQQRQEFVPESCFFTHARLIGDTR